MKYRSEILIYLVIPFAIMAVLLGLHFSRIPLLAHLVVPPINGLDKQAWREYGLLEILQNIYLLGIVLLFVRCMRCAPAGFEKWFFRGSIIFTAIVLLEEIDYGLFLYEFVTKRPLDWSVRNWHNQDSFGRQNVSYLKLVVDLGLILGALGLLIGLRRKAPESWRHLIPSVWFVATLVLTVVVVKGAHWYSDRLVARSLDTMRGLAHNVSEFRELNLYYMLLVYSWQQYRLTYPDDEESEL